MKKIMRVHKSYFLILLYYTAIYNGQDKVKCHLFIPINKYIIKCSLLGKKLFLKKVT